MKYIKAKKIVPRRILAFLLTFSMTATSFLSVISAQVEESHSNPIELSGFATLPGEVREQRVPLGVSLGELMLPDKLEATVYSPLEDTEVTPPEEPEKPQDDEMSSEAAEETPSSDDETAEETSTSADDETSEETSTSADDETSEETSTSADDETSEETSTAADDETAEETSPSDEDETSEETSPSDEDETSEETPSSDEDETSEETSHSDENEILEENSTYAGERSISGDSDSMDDLVRQFSNINFDAKQAKLEREISTANITAGDDLPAVTLPDTEPEEPESKSKTIIIHDVTWKSVPVFNEEEPGEYTFTAILPEQYILAGGLDLPEIHVTVYDSAKVIGSWEWNDPEGFLTEGELVLSGVNADNPITLDRLISMLPADIHAILDTRTAQDDGGEERESVPVSLLWSSKDFVQGEDGKWPVQGTYSFTASMKDGYTLSKGAPPLEITVRLGGAMLLPTGDVFSKLEIRRGSATGDVVVDLLDPASDWKLSVATDYYICAELTKPADATHVQFRYGNEDGTYNSVTFANPPGGTYEPNKPGFDSDPFDELTACEYFDDPTYGPDNSTPFKLQDGTMTYRIKNKEASGKVSFTMGMVIKDETFTGGDLLDAICISVGTYADDTFTPSANDGASCTISLNMQNKAQMFSRFTTKTQSAPIGSIGGVLYYYPASITNSDPEVAYIYDSVEFDLTYPVGANLSVGFSSNSTGSTNATFGRITIEDATPVGTDGKLEKRHIKIANGLKLVNQTLMVCVRLDFMDATKFQPAQTWTITAENPSVTIGGTKLESHPFNGKPDSNTAQYTLYAGGEDKTSLVGTSRTVYNHTIDMGEDARYTIPMGTAALKNTDTGNATPHEKTFEAQYNTGNTAANISYVLVPVGTSDNPLITWDGIDENGNIMSGVVANANTELKTYLNSSNGWASSSYLLLPAEHFGIASFTSIKAEIGKLPAGFNATSNPDYISYSYLVCSAYGYFTNGEPGLVVQNTFRIYNTDVSLQDKTNGDLSAEGIAISTDFCGLGVAVPAYSRLNGVEMNTQSAINGGGTAVLTGALLPYVIPNYTYNTGASSAKGTTALAVDPVFYLTLPQGISLIEEDMSFQQQTVAFRSSPVITELEHTVENVTYLNKTGDGVTIYKITFPDNTMWGYYNGEAAYKNLQYSIPLRTSKSLATTRYFLNDLFSVTAKNEMSALMLAGNNKRNTFIKEDIYGLNGGKTMAGVTSDSSGNIGFTVQQQAEINVYNAVAVTKINGQTVPEQWYSYDASDPNSIAMLGQSSEGRLRLQVSNTSKTPGTKFAMVLPLPKSGLDLGDVFMAQTPEFDLSMEYDGAASHGAYTVKYIRVDTDNNSIPPEGVDALPYTEVSPEAANAILVTADSVPEGDYYLYLDFTLSDGTPDAIDIWRPAYSYTVGTTTERRSAYGSYVASAVAGSGISGLVWNDVNRNGRRDAGEDGISGITVVAEDSKGRILSATTDAGGSYEFLAVRESLIKLSFVTNSSQSLRFNVPPLADSTASTVSTVLPDTSGLRATRSLTATGRTTKVNAAMSGFITLAYNGNGNTGGNLPKTVEYVSGANGTVAVKPDNLVKTGYRFMAWNTMADGTGTSYQPGNTLAITEDVTLYAIWALDSYTVTFNYRGATGGNGEASRILGHGAEYGPLPSPTKTGYDFKGWTNTAAGTVQNVTAATKFTEGKDTTVYALWAPKAGFTVTYNTNGGNSIASKTVAWTDDVLSGGATRTGYDFVEWRYIGSKVLATDTFGDLSPSDAAGSSITLDAVWKAKSGFTVNYDTKGGTPDSISPKTVTWAEKNLLPALKPTKTGEAFAGWWIGAIEATNAHSYGDLAVADTTLSITLEAKWVPVTGNVVSYDTDGGSPVNDKVNVGNDDTNLLPDTTPTKPGYTLAKWVVSGSEREVNDSTAYKDLSSADTLTLKAVWAEKNYTIKYETNSTLNIADKTDAKWSSSLLPIQVPDKDGYIFAGWFFDGDGVEAAATVSTLIPNDDAVNDTLTLQAHWTERTYTVQYNSVGGGNFTPKANVKYTDDGLLPDTAPAKKGYTFEGWFVGTTKVEAATVCSTLLTDPMAAGITLTAKWQVKNNFTVKYDTAGGPNISDKTAVGWTDAGLLPATPPTKNGYAFTNWTAGRIAVTNATPYSAIAESDQAGTYVTLVAVWGEKSGFTVKYDTGSGTPIGDKTVTWNEQIVSSTFPTRTGYTFDGWKHGSTPVSDAAKYSELAVQDTVTEITLTAIWTERNDYTVRYDTGGGTVISDLTGVKANDKNLLPGQEPQKNGYRFAGWKFGDVTITNDTVYNTLTSENSLTLTAQWTEKYYTISYDVAGYGSTSKKWTESGLLPNVDPEQNGYTFDGWYYGPSKVETGTRVSALIPLDDTDTILLTAHWNKNSDTDTDISGTVEDDSGNPVENASVRLTQGSTTVYGPTATDSQGKYLLSDLSSGIYNLVAEKNGQTVTVIVTIKDHSLNQNLVLPAKEKNSILDVKGSDTPAVVVGNLDEIAKNTPLDAGSNSLTIKLTVQKEAEQTNGKETEHSEIRKKAGADATILFLDALLTKQVDNNQPINIGNSNNVVLEMVIPFELAEKENIRVYRYHDNVNAFRQLSAKPAGALEDQTCYLDESAELIHVYAKKYSTYAIAYSAGGGGEDSGGGSGGGSGSGGGDHQYYDIFLSAGTGGHIQPDKSKVTVRGGNSAGFDFVPDNGYHVAEVKVDGRSIGAVSTYLFRNVRADHNLSVSFENVPVTPDNPGMGGPAIPADPILPGQSQLPIQTFPPLEQNQSRVSITDDFGQVGAGIMLPGEIIRGGVTIPAIPEAPKKDEPEKVKPEVLEKPSDESDEAADELPRNITAAPEKVLPTQGDSQSPPFILLSALSALLATVCAALTLRSKRSKKTRVVAMTAALAAVVVFFLTSGWSGIELANTWTVLIVVLTVIPVGLMFRKVNREEPQEEEQETVR